MPTKGTTRAWDLWRTIEDSHALQDASLRYDGWTTLFVIGILAVHKKPNETYLTIVPRTFAIKLSVLRSPTRSGGYQAGHGPPDELEDDPND